jgi:hypothetical protein
MGRTAKSKLAKLKQYVKQSNGIFSIERDVITQCEYLSRVNILQTMRTTRAV